jgi:hypothetical protein
MVQVAVAESTVMEPLQQQQGDIQVVDMGGLLVLL